MTGLTCADCKHLGPVVTTTAMKDAQPIAYCGRRMTWERPETERGRPGGKFACQHFRRKVIA